MSISFRKINSMIESEVSCKELTDEQKKMIGDLCTKIYLIESSLEKGGSSQVTNEIRGEISLRSDDYSRLL
jgi:hypothetical protein